MRNRQTEKERDHTERQKEKVNIKREIKCHTERGRKRKAESERQTDRHTQRDRQTLTQSE